MHAQLAADTRHLVAAERRLGMDGAFEFTEITPAWMPLATRSALPMSRDQTEPRARRACRSRCAARPPRRRTGSPSRPARRSPRARSACRWQRVEHRRLDQAPSPNPRVGRPPPTTIGRPPRAPTRCSRAPARAAARRPAAPSRSPGPSGRRPSTFRVASANSSTTRSCTDRWTRTAAGAADLAAVVEDRDGDPRRTARGRRPRRRCWGTCRPARARSSSRWRRRAADLLAGGRLAREGDLAHARVRRDRRARRRRPGP